MQYHGAVTLQVGEGFVFDLRQLIPLPHLDDKIEKRILLEGRRLIPDAFRELAEKEL